MWSWLTVFFMTYKVSLPLGAYSLLIVLSLSDKGYHLKKRRKTQPAATSWTPEWQLSSESCLSHIIPCSNWSLGSDLELLISDGIWVDTCHYKTVCEITELGNMGRKTSTCQISPLHSICIYVCAYARPPSSRKNWMHPWHFSICTKRFVPSSFPQPANIYF